MRPRWKKLDPYRDEPGAKQRRRAAQRPLVGRRPHATVGRRPRLRLSLVGVLLAALFAAMFARLYYLQVLQAPKYSTLATQNTDRIVATPAPRGLLLDRSGKPVVSDQAAQVVTLDRVTAKAHPGIIPRLAAVLHMTPAQVHAQLNSNQYTPYQPVPVKTGVPLSTVIYLREHQSDFPGVATHMQGERAYPYKSLAAQYLGYVTPISANELHRANAKGGNYKPGDLYGQSGIEAVYQHWLRGQQGEKKLAVDAQGRIVGTVGTTPPVQGNSVQLAMDLGLQQQADKALAGEVRNAGAASGAAVVLNPQNGKILAMSSYPTYDPSVWVGGISTKAYKSLTDKSSNYPMLNRAIQGLYTPGSTFKLATATAALQTGLISPSYIYNDTGSFDIPNCSAGLCSFHNSGHEVAGPINVTQAITQSIDTFFYNLGFQFYVHSKQYGPDPIQKVARAYGLGVKPTTPLPGAVAGRVDGPGVRKKLHAEAPKAFPYTSWSPGDAVEMAFGQGGTIITPLELATAYATFANGGTRYEPQPAANVLSPEGKVVKSFQPVVTGHVKVAPANRAAMLKGFIGAVQDPQGTAGGTFAGFPFNQLQVAGKTGTSSNATGKPDSLFVAFAGKNLNHPQYVVAVVIPHSGFGASFAAPVARQILQYLAVHPAGPVAAPKPVSVLAPPPGPRASHRATTGSTLFPLPTLPGGPGPGPQGAGHTAATLFPLPTAAGRPAALGPAGRSPP